LENTIIIFTADHGESLGEHDIYFDHHGLYQNTLRIPLLIFHPSFVHKCVYKNTLHTDLKNIIISILKDEFEANNIVNHERIVALENYTESKIALIDTKNRKKIIKSTSKKDAICKYCNRIHGGLHEFYDIKKDPLEMKNIYDRTDPLIREYEKSLERYLLRFKLLKLKYKELN